jgi:hypothetical protein
MRKYNRERNKVRVRIFLVIILLILLCSTFFGKTGNKNLRYHQILTVGILTTHRQNAFYLNEVVQSLNYDNVHVFDADIDHVDLYKNFDQPATIHKIYSGEYTEYLPFYVKTDAHKTHRYDGVNVVRSRERISWWRRQNKDFLKMARYLRDNQRSDYYLIMEDDNVYQGSSDILSTIDKSQPLVHMGLGAGALMMSDAFLESFIGYMMLRTDAQPVDWLLELFMDSIGRKLVHRKMFNHVGSVSTKPDQRPGMF